MKRFLKWLALHSFIFVVILFTYKQVFATRQPNTITKWMRIIPAGKTVFADDRKMVMTDELMNQILEKFARRLGGVPIIYQHGGTLQSDIAAGWIDTLRKEKDGIYAHLWLNEEATTLIRNKRWGYTSTGTKICGVEDQDYVKPCDLIELSLVNQPAVVGLTPLWIEKDDVPEKSN